MGVLWRLNKRGSVFEEKGYGIRTTSGYGHADGDFIKLDNVFEVNNNNSHKIMFVLYFYFRVNTLKKLLAL